MTIQFACDCGRQLAAADEHAGKRVKCTACGGIQTVPGGEPAPRWVAEPAPLIRFVCDGCGQTCQARPEHAGRKTRCPKCASVLLIPGGAAALDDVEEVSASRTDALLAERPLARPGRRPAFEEEERADEDDFDRPRRRRSIKKSRKWLWLSTAAAILVLLGGALALFLLLNRKISDDFDLVPRDAQGFVTVRVADLLNAPLGKKVMAKFDQQSLAPLKEVEGKLGLTLNDLERVTAVFVDVEQELVWIIVKTKRPYDKNKVLALAGGKPVEATHGGKTYQRVQNAAYLFLTERLLVVGSEKGVKRCIELPKKPKSGPLDDALRAASKGKNQFAAGGNLTAANAARIRAELEKQEGAKVWLDKFAALFDLRTAFMTAAVKENIDWELALTFSDSSKAKKGEETINDLLGVVRTFLPFARQALQQQGVEGKNADEAIAQAQKGLQQFKPKRSGSTVSMTWTDSGSQLLKGIDNAKKQFNQLWKQGGFGQ